MQGRRACKGRDGREQPAARGREDGGEEETAEDAVNLCRARTRMRGRGEEDEGERREP